MKLEKYVWTKEHLEKIYNNEYDESVHFIETISDQKKVSKMLDAFLHITEEEWKSSVFTRILRSDYHFPALSIIELSYKGNMIDFIYDTDEKLNTYLDRISISDGTTSYLFYGITMDYYIEPIDYKIKMIFKKLSKYDHING